jgi:hypothetical protein
MNARKLNVEIRNNIERENQILETGRLFMDFVVVERRREWLLPNGLAGIQILGSR